MSTITRAVIPAAGLGTRMRPLTGGGPKELLPMAGKPAIAHALAEAALAGCRMAVVVIGKGKQNLAEKLPAYAPQGLDLVFALQPRPLGECDAIAHAGPYLGSGPFAVIYPDNIAHPPGALALAARTCLETGRDALALMRVDDALTPGISDSGRIDMDRDDNGTYLVTRFHEKGSGPFVTRFPGEMRTCGIYAALPHYLEFIEQARAELEPGQELTDGKVRRLMLAKGVIFAGAPVPGTVFDVGNPQGYRLCLEALARS